MTKNSLNLTAYQEIMIELNGKFRSKLSSYPFQMSLPVWPDIHFTRNMVTEMDLEFLLQKSQIMLNHIPHILLVL